MIDVDRLYANSGIATADLELDLTIRGRDGKGTNGETFFGSEDVLAHDPLTTTVNIPGGTWELAATPKGGWPAPPNTTVFRLMIVFIGLLVCAADPYYQPSLRRTAPHP